nr:hypothetical protein [Tanacetum cinerariifolium]
QWLLGVSGRSRGEWCGVVREARKCGTRAQGPGFVWGEVMEVMGSGENGGKRGREWLQGLAGKTVVLNSILKQTPPVVEL